MQKDNNEILSTLVDGEHGKNKNILEDLAHNDIMKGTWRRYHLIRDCLRGNLSEKIHNNFISKLNLHLKNEPTIISNTKTKQFKLEPIIGFAIAASVAAVAILVIQNKNNISPIEIKDNIVMDEKIIDSQFETFSFPEAQISPAAVEQSVPFNSITQQRLNNYLINHSKYKNNIKMNSVLPYARIVTIEPKE